MRVSAALVVSIIFAAAVVRLQAFVFFLLVGFFRADFFDVDREFPPDPLAFFLAALRLPPLDVFFFRFVFFVVRFRVDPPCSSA